MQFFTTLFFALRIPSPIIVQVSYIFFFFLNLIVTTLTLGLQPRQGVWKGASWKCNLGVTFTFLGVRESVREWAHLGVILPMYSWNFLENNLRGQNSFDWRNLFNIGKFLKRKCLKWTWMIHLSTYNRSYGQKKVRESKCQFNSWPLKVDNHSELHACRWCTTCHWKALDESYNFFLDLISIRSIHKKLWASKVAKVPISKLSIWESWGKWHLGAVLMVNHREYYKREGGGFPQV